MGKRQRQTSASERNDTYLLILYLRHLVVNNGDFLIISIWRVCDLLDDRDKNSSGKDMYLERKIGHSLLIRIISIRNSSFWKKCIQD